MYSVGKGVILVSGLMLFPVFSGAPAEIPTDKEIGIQRMGPESPRWSVSGYVGQVTYTRFNEIVRLDTDFRSSYVAVLAASRVLFEHGDLARWELEGQVARHWGKQRHGEINAALLLRWRRFPWDDFLDTSIALGAGPSYASEVPAIEADRHDRASRRLFYMPFEITAAPPGGNSWEVFTRVHHRSGVFDALSRAGGSNFVGMGFRRRF